MEWGTNRMLLGQFGKFERELYMKSGLLKIECTQKSPQESC